MNWYNVLGVTPDADAGQLKRAYRSLARSAHPDRGGSGEAFVALHHAYSVLANTATRAAHDAELALSVNDKRTDREPVAGPVVAPARFGADAWSLDGERGADVSARVVVDQRTAVFGGSVALRRNRFEPCPSCRGTGVNQGSNVVCERCQGMARVIRFVTHELEVAPRSTAGTAIRLVGLGDAGARSRDVHGVATSGCGPCGSVIVELHPAPGETIGERGDDLITSIRVPTFDALLGDQRIVALLDGSHLLRIPPGVQPGQRLRIVGRGAPRRVGDGRGDFLVEVNVETIDDLDETERKVLSDLRAARQRRHAVVGDTEPATEAF